MTTAAPAIDTAMPNAFKRGRGLPPCHSRREYDARHGQFVCVHPKVHSSGNLVTSSICRACSWWLEPPPEAVRLHPEVTEVDRLNPCMYLGKQVGLRLCNGCRGTVHVKEFACSHPEHDITTLQECNVCSDYAPALAMGTIRTWAVGITTAPRQRSTLEVSAASLLYAGFDEFRLFAEPNSEIPPALRSSPCTWRDSVLGAWPNWWLALYELYLRHPFADAFLIAQDDVLYCRHLREYLEQSLWPASRLGLVSLYNPLTNSDEVRRFYELDSSLPLAGALALAIPNASARSLFGYSGAIDHRRRGPTAGLAHIELAISSWAKARDLPIYQHGPSLTQHIGDTTTIGAATQDKQLRRAKQFVGEQSDARQLLGDEPEGFTKALEFEDR